VNLDTQKHQAEFAHQLWTAVDDVVGHELCKEIADRARRLVALHGFRDVDHGGSGSRYQLDGGGRYRFHLADGLVVREHFCELVAIYQVLRYWIGALTLYDVVMSPYRESDVTIQLYPPEGGTIGPHYDTNGITALLYLTSNGEGPLRMWPRNKDPWGDKNTETLAGEEPLEVFPKAGTIVLMEGRRLWHESRPMETEDKVVVLFNYYVRGDVGRPDGFDSFIYHGLANEREHQ